MRQAEMDCRLDLEKGDVAAGRVQVVDDAFFDRLLEYVRQVTAKR